MIKLFELLSSCDVSHLSRWFVELSLKRVTPDFAVLRPPSTESTGMEQAHRDGNVRWTSHMMMMNLIRLAWKLRASTFVEEHRNPAESKRAFRTCVSNRAWHV